MLMTNKEKRKIIGVYKITNPKGKVYVGSSINIDNRFYWYKKTLAKQQPILNASFNKYGVDNHIFEIVEECTVENLFKREREIGMDYDSINPKKGLNIKLPRLGEEKVLCSDELRAKLSKLAKERKYSKETRLKMRMAKVGKEPNNNKNKIVLNMQNGVFYNSIKEASKAHGISRTALSLKLNLKGHYKKNKSNLCLV